MTLTLLFDLDDTLLGNSMDSFIPAYLSSLCEHLSPYLPADKLVSSLISGTQAMLDKSSPAGTLKDTFDQAFYPVLGINEADYYHKFEGYYRDVFPDLKPLTRFLPDAVSTIEESFKRGYNVAIATNPLFPHAAIKQRLEWAGLSPELYPFLVVPSYETFHFAKPHSAFFTESLAALGWPDGPVVMVGDNYDQDIGPARSMGMGNFWMVDEDQINGHDMPVSAGMGKIQDLFSWIDTVAWEHLEPDFNRVETMLAVLRATPAALHAFSREFENDNWDEHPHPGEWNYTEIMCHLRDVDIEVNTPRIAQVLDGNNPFLPGIDTDRWAQERVYYCQNGPQALVDFANSRVQLLNLLDSLENADWERPANHAIFGPTSLKEIVSIIVGHDQLHIRQAFQFKGDITYQTTTRASRE